MEPQKETLPEFKKQVGKFFISEKVLGKGASAEVRLGCFAENKNQLVAVKMIDKKNITEKDPKKFIDLLQREISILQSLSHQNIVKMMDVSQTNNYIYIFLEFCNGGSLKDYIKKKGGYLSEKEAIIFFKEICEAFKVMEEKKIIHRDIKQENVMINNDQVKISDFGFSRVIEVGDPNYYSRLGTPLYMPPQIIKGERYGPKCDVWSVGILLYTMLYGFHPFISKSEESKVTNLVGLLKNIENRDVKFPDKPARSQTVKKLLIGMLGKKEEDRLSWSEVFESDIVKRDPNEVKKNNEILEKEIDDFTKSVVMNRLYMENRRVIDVIQANAQTESTTSLTEAMKNITMSDKGNDKDKDTNLISQEAGLNEDKEKTENVAQNLEEQKYSKYAKRFNDYLLFERNLSMFFNNLVTKLYSVVHNKLLEVPSDVYFRMMFLICKYAVLSMQRVMDVLMNKIKIINKNPHVWDYYVKTAYFRRTKRLVESDLEKITNMFKEIDKRTKMELVVISEKENDMTILKNLSSFLEKTTTNKYENLEQVGSDIKLLVKEFLITLKNSLDKNEKDTLILIKYLIISSEPYKYFKWNTQDNLSEPDFEIFYEEVENSEKAVLIAEIKKHWL